MLASKWINRLAKESCSDSLKKEYFSPPTARWKAAWEKIPVQLIKFSDFKSDVKILQYIWVFVIQLFAFLQRTNGSYSSDIYTYPLPYTHHRGRPRVQSSLGLVGRKANLPYFAIMKMNNLLSWVNCLNTVDSPTVEASLGIHNQIISSRKEALASLPVIQSVWVTNHSFWASHFPALFLKK